MFCDDTALNMDSGEAAYARQVYVDGLLWFNRDDEPDIPTQVSDDVTVSSTSGFSGVNPATTFAPENTWTEWSVTSSEDNILGDLVTTDGATNMNADPSPLPTNWGKLGYVLVF